MDSLDPEPVTEESQALQAEIVDLRQRLAESERQMADSASAELRLENERLRLLSIAAEYLLQANEPQQMLHGLFQAMSKQFELDLFISFAVDEEAGKLTLEASEGVPEHILSDLQELRMEDVICGTVARDRCICELTEEDIHTNPRAQLLEQLGVRAYFCQPLIVDDRVAGTLGFGSRTLPNLPPDLLQFLRTLGHYVTAAKERARSEAAVRTSEEKFRRIFFSANEGIWMVDTRAKIVSVNPRMAQMLGYSVEEMYGRRKWDFLFLEDIRAFQELFERRRLGISEQADVRFRHRDGRELWMLMAARPLFDDQNRFVGALDFFTDVTQRRRAELALREREEHFRMAIDAGQVGTWDWDVLHNRLHWSERIYDFHGVRQNEFAGSMEDFERLLHPDERERVHEAINAALRREKPYAIEYRIVRPNGEIRWLVTNGRAFFDRNGNPLRMLGATVDITDRKRSEIELSEAQQAAEAANMAKDRFLATLSHELRTPLNPVMLSVSALVEDAKLDLETRRELALIRTHIDLESRLIDDLLDLSAIGQSKMQLQMAIIDARNPLEHALHVIQPESGQKRIRIDADMGDKPLWTRADPARLEQVFWNVLKNAVKFTPFDAEISVHASGDGELLRFEVKDCGRGIDPAVLPRIFNPFEQGDAQVTKLFGGLGLGLAVAKKLIDLHGGTITAHSEGRGHGTTFVIELVPSEAPAKPGADFTRATPVPTNKLNILLVEDHEATASVMHRILTKWGHKVESASNLRTAKEMCANNSFDLLISDLGLPDGSGLDLMEVLREKNPIPAIAITGFGMAEDIEATRRAGFMDHLIKPVDVQKLREAITNAIVQIEEPVA